LRAEKFDLGVAEFITVCPYALYRKIGIKKYITASATPVGAGFGIIFGARELFFCGFDEAWFVRSVRSGSKKTWSVT
jgi:hypothetical protein